eukprot:gene45234-61288_t
MSWGHDEYVYQMMKDTIPESGLYMLRYHSFYSWHREGQYEHLLDDHDREMLKWVKLFNPYDLYSKNPTPPVWSELKGYYEDLLIAFETNVKTAIYYEQNQTIARKALFCLLA